MIKNKIVQLLTKIGLSENEAVVYFTGLNLGSTTVAQLAKRPKLNAQLFTPLLNH